MFLVHSENRNEIMSACAMESLGLSEKTSLIILVCLGHLQYSSIQIADTSWDAPNFLSHITIWSLVNFAFMYELSHLLLAILSINWITP